MMNKSERMSLLTEIINNAIYAYYVKKKPIMSDFEYDKLSKELSELKKEDKNE